MLDLFELYGYSLTWIMGLIAVLIFIIGLKNGQGGRRDKAALIIACLALAFGLYLTFVFTLNYSRQSDAIRRSAQGR